MHRYSVEIRIFLSNRGLCCFVDEYDATKKYDIFVSFAHEDEAFVIDKLLPKLEVNYKVCVHHRDWRVGDLIPTQIARSVEESRRTLIVLSRHFLASTWGMLEFRAAHVQAAKERKVRVVVLLLEDISDIEIESELRAYLTTNTYIKWGDQWFWEKLQYALPRRAKAEDVRSEKRAKIAADNMAKGGLQVTLTPDGKLVNTAMNKIVI
ncbi:hypothetical protein O3G_MSEX001000 [Manduca sexta]|nr:hypothetical protein O3G_MSEX001000 [Manduca sexta]KAG6439698.1 hypothetical protein O3G_MSEX001000 [Manduca sexta]